jgi:uncharacterized protein (AIM24 family)
MGDPSTLFKRARDLFQQGLPDQAEEIVGQLLRANPRDATALNFQAYLLYKRGKVDEAIALYRRLVKLEPGVPGHHANLGLICFKAGRYPEAQEAFERLVELQPGDGKALCNLGLCHARQNSLERALDCFTRAGDEKNAAEIRARLVRPEKGTPAQTSAALHAGVAAGEGAAGGASPRRGEASEPDLDEWLAGASLPRPGEGPDLVRPGPGELVVKVREKVFINPAYCIAHRGIVVFAPASRESEKAAAKFGERHGVLARAEGNGELVLSGLGRGLHALHLGGGRLFVNWGSLVLCGTGVAVAFDHVGLIKETFLAAELSGAGRLVLAARGGPVVIPVVADLPTLVRPEAVVAWTEGLGWEAEPVPELKKLVGKAESLRYRFEGKGYLVLQSC